MDLQRLLYAIPLRLRSVFRRRTVERELDEELSYHLDRLTEQYQARGLPPAEARRQALRELDGIERPKDECRDARGVTLLDDGVRDVAYGARTLRRSPGFAVVAIVTLALGIGATTIIFSVVNGILLRPLPYPASDRLVNVRYEKSGTVAPGTYLDWKAASGTIERMAAASYWTPALTGNEKAEEILALKATTDLLPLLGVEPLLGRIFSPDEGHTAQSHVAVLRYESWQRRFAGDSGIIGKAIRLDGEPYTIIGVMPPGFRFVPFWASDAELCAPLPLDEKANDRTGASLRILGRRRPGATMEQAQADLAAISARLERLYPGTNQHVTLVPLRDVVVGPVRDALLILLTAVGLLLLIACANVAHLQLMRAAVREREFALRTALGASGGRLFRQSLVESLLLSAAGGALGLAAAAAGIRLLAAFAPPGLPRVETVRVDAVVLLTATALTFLCALLFGMAPALTAARANVHRTLKEGGRGSSDTGGRRRLRATLVVSEFAMAVILLTGAGLVLRSFAAMLSVDPGYDPHGVLSLKVAVRGTQWNDRARRTAFYDRLVDEVRTVPGVQAVSAVNHLPLHGDSWHFPFSIEGRPPALPGERPSALFRVVRPGYFGTMRIPLVAGREFTEADVSRSAHLAIVSEYMARAEWPGANPLGQRISVDDPASGADWYTVVGVSRNVRQDNWSDPPADEMYFPELAAPADSTATPRLADFLSPGYMTLVIRLAPGAPSPAARVRSLVRALEPDAPVSDVITMEDAVREQFAQPRFYLMLLGGFAAVAVLLAAVGVYGVISYSVERRTAEIGIRLALGARRSDPFRLVLREGLTLATVGTGIGLLGAAGLTRYLASLLYGVGAEDPVTFVAAPVLLAGIALVAVLVPAWRASRVDPAVALRAE